jgi:hypothetical protein
VFSVRGLCREGRREYKNENWGDFSSEVPKGTAVWPEEELEDPVCDVTCAVVH